MPMTGLQHSIAVVIQKNAQRFGRGTGEITEHRHTSQLVMTQQARPAMPEIIP